MLDSKQDLKELETRVDHRFSQLESKLSIVESRLTIRMGTMLAASIAILTAIHKLV